MLAAQKGFRVIITATALLAMLFQTGCVVVVTPNARGVAVHGAGPNAPGQGHAATPYSPYTYGYGSNPYQNGYNPYGQYGYNPNGTSTAGYNGAVMAGPGAATNTTDGSIPSGAQPSQLEGTVATQLIASFNKAHQPTQVTESPTNLSAPAFKSAIGYFTTRGPIAQVASQESFQIGVDIGPALDPQRLLATTSTTSGTAPAAGGPPAGTKPYTADELAGIALAQLKLRPEFNTFLQNLPKAQGANPPQMKAAGVGIVLRSQGGATPTGGVLVPLVMTFGKA